jgi:hypothetical protein
MNIHSYSNIHTYRHSLIYIISDIHYLEKVKNFETCINFFFAGIKAQQYEASSRRVLGNNTCSMYSSYIKNIGVWISTFFPAYLYMADNMHTQL